MLIQIEENNYLAELIIELARRYENLNNMYPQEWLTRRSDEDDR